MGLATPILGCPGPLLGLCWPLSRPRGGRRLRESRFLSKAFRPPGVGELGVGQDEGCRASPGAESP